MKDSISNTHLFCNWLHDHKLKADTAPSFKLTATGSEGASFVQPRKRLPLKMVISEIASRDSDTVGTEPEYTVVSPRMDNMSPHTFLSKKKDPSRCFPEKSLVDPKEDALAQSEHEIFSKIFEDCDEETPSLDCQSIFVKGSHSEGDECSKSADKTKVFPQGYYSTPCAKLRFNSLYGNEVLNKTVKHNDFSYMRKYKDGKITTDYQCPSSAMSREFDIDTCYEHDIEDTNDNVNLKSYSLFHSPTNAISPVSSKGDHDSINTATILSSSSASSPSYSSINICSDWSTEDERGLISNKRKFDSDYTSENRFLHPLVNFKSKQWKAQNSETNLLHTVKTRNVSDWKSECEYTVSNSKCINSNNDQMFSIGNLSSIYRESNSDTLHDEAQSSADLTFSYRIKYTRRKQTITLSTQPFGLPDSAR